MRSFAIVLRTPDKRLRIEELKVFIWVFSTKRSIEFPRKRDNAFNFTLILGGADPRRVGDGVVVFTQLGERAVERRVIDIRGKNTRLEIVEIQPR
jgi:hypothetical protein